MFLMALWRNVVRRDRVESDLDEEMRGVYAMLMDEKIRAGVDPAEARRKAAIELGGVEQLKERVRDVRVGVFLESVLQDLRYAARAMRHNRGFAYAAVLTLGLGIALNTVVFGVLEALLLRPLPIEDPSRVYFVQPRGGFSLSFPNYRDFRDRSKSFSDLAGYRMVQIALDSGDSPRIAWGDLVTGNYFATLGLKPVVGRFFGGETDTTAPGSSPYVVLSYDTWQTRFAGDPAIEGKTLRVNGYPYTILGVAPSGFTGTEVLFNAGFWIPISMQAQIEGRSWLESRTSWNTLVIGRLGSAVSEGEARAEINTITRQLAREYPGPNDALTITLSTPGLFGDMWRTPLISAGIAVMLLSGLMLLIVCTSITSLIAARMVERAQEISVRLALGVGRGRLLRQIGTEAALLACCGAGVGLVLAALLLRALGRWQPPLPVPSQIDLMPDVKVFAFAIALSLLVALLASIGSLQRVWRATPGRIPHQASPRVTAGRAWHVRDGLLAIQIALSCVLVTACFVSIRNLTRALIMPIGIDPHGVHAVGFDLGLFGYTPDEGRRFQSRVVQNLSQLPQVTSVAAINSVPLSIDQNNTSVFLDNATDFRASQAIQVKHFEVSPGYFRTVETRLVSGRDFTDHDDEQSPRVVIVNETLARRIFGSADAVGRFIRFGRQARVEVVGVAHDGKYETLNEPARPAVFEPSRQSYNSTTVLLVKSLRPDSDVSADMRRILADADGRIAPYMDESLSRTLSYALLPARTAAITLTAFGILALMIALVSITGLAAYSVRVRRREIGIRAAVGASPGQLIITALGRTAAVIGLGCAFGVGFSLAINAALSAVVYHATTREPLTILLVVLTMGLIGLFATWPAARSALRVRPVELLHGD